MHSCVLYVHSVELIFKKRYQDKRRGGGKIRWLPIVHGGGHVFVISHVLAVAALSLEADGVEDGLQLHPAHGRGLLSEEQHYHHIRSLLLIDS